MWVESVLLAGDQVVDVTELDGWHLTVGMGTVERPRMLLAHLILTEDATGCAACSALTLLAVQGDAATRSGTIDLARPLLTPSPTEQRTLRAWLIERNWPAWARAALSVRTLLGAAEPAILLADAARQWMLPLPTLSGAAVAERLPTMRVGDRHLVYSATIGEAIARGVLRSQRGRPRRSG
jgi:hypothetical protein